MSWLEPPARHRHPWPVRILLWILATRGRLSGSVRQWARAPRVFLAFQRLYRAVDRGSSPLEPALRSLVMARVSQVNRCPFCVDLNGSRALERGATAAQLDEMARHAGSALFGRREKAALAFADAVAAAGGTVPPELQQELRAVFSDEAIVELAALVAFQDMSSKFNLALGVPAEGPFRAAPGGPGARAAGDR